jgi:hypothetical protein
MDRTLLVAHLVRSRLCLPIFKLHPCSRRGRLERYGFSCAIFRGITSSGYLISL